MDDELTPEQRFAADDADEMVPRALRQGRSQDDIVAELVRLDWTQPAARAFVARVADDLRRYQASPQSREELVQEAKKQLIIGIASALFGVAITVFSIIAPAPVIVVAFGLVFWGLVQASRGWSRLELYAGGGRAESSQGEPSQPATPDLPADRRNL